MATKPDEDPPKTYGIREEDAAGIGAGHGDDDAPVPKLPRGSGFKLSTPHLMRIGMIVVTLFALVVLQKPCSNAVSRFVTTFGGEESAGKGSNAASQPAPAAAPAAPAATSPAPSPTPSTVTGPDRGAPAGSPPIQYERLTPSMTDEELRAAIERAKRRAATAERAGSGNAPPAPPSPPPPSPSASSGGQ